MAICTICDDDCACAGRILTVDGVAVGGVFCGSALCRFATIANAFEAATGFVMPGRDSAAEMGSSDATDPARRWAAWRSWVVENDVRVIAIWPPKI